MLERPAFPRSNRYDPDWVMAHHMGPNPLWLVAWLAEAMALAPGWASSTWGAVPP